MISKVLYKFQDMQKKYCGCLRFTEANDFHSFIKVGGWYEKDKN